MKTSEFKKTINEMLETDRKDIVVQICDKEGNVAYKDFKLFLSDESILIEVEEINKIEE